MLRQTHPPFGTAGVVLLAAFAAQLLSGSRWFFEADAWTLPSFRRDELDAGSFQGGLDFPERPNRTCHLSGLLYSFNCVDPNLSQC